MLDETLDDRSEDRDGTWRPAPHDGGHDERRGERGILHRRARAEARQEDRESGRRLLLPPILRRRGWKSWDRDHLLRLAPSACSPQPSRCWRGLDYRVARTRACSARVVGRAISGTRRG